MRFVIKILGRGPFELPKLFCNNDRKTVEIKFPERTIKKVQIFPGRISFFPVTRLIFFGKYEGDPLSPQKGEAAQGEPPLTPFSSKVLDQPSE
jgi:hypothetical protein